LKKRKAWKLEILSNRRPLLWKTQFAIRLLFSLKYRIKSRWKKLKRKYIYDSFFSRKKIYSHLLFTLVVIALTMSGPNMPGRVAMQFETP
jgi:hypothetical protein